MSESSLRTALTVAAQQLDKLGLNRGTSGNVSVRCADEFLVTPSGVAPDELCATSMVRMRFDGVAEPGKRASSEWRIHRDVLQSRSDINAAVHVHSTFATTMSTLRREIPPFHYMVAVAGGETIRCTDYALFGSEALSQLALAALRERKACLLGNHGMLSLGASLNEAIAVAVEVEALCEQYWRALQVAEPHRLSHEEMLDVIERFKSYGRFSSDPSDVQQSK